MHAASNKARNVDDLQIESIDDLFTVGQQLEARLEAFQRERHEQRETDYQRYAAASQQLYERFNTQVEALRSELGVDPLAFAESGAEPDMDAAGDTADPKFREFEERHAQLESELRKVQERMQRRQERRSRREGEADERALREFRSALRAEVREKVERIGTLHDESRASIDMQALVFGSEQDRLRDILSDPDYLVSLWYEQQSKDHDARKDLVAHALRLTPLMSPKIFRIVEQCRESLGLREEIEVYIQPDPTLNAVCYPPIHGKALLGLTSALIERLEEAELRFVIGHEIGHYLYHTRFTGFGGGHDQTTALKLYSWNRSREVTADRVGLLCCGNPMAAASALFKLSSGVSRGVLTFDLDDYLKQLSDIEAEYRGEDDPQAWFTTHPFSPLRLKALLIFADSAFFRESTGQAGGLHREELEQQTSALLATMDSNYQDCSDAEIQGYLQEFVLMTGLLLARADGTVGQEEVQALQSIMPGDWDQQALADMQQRSTSELEEELPQAATRLTHLLGDWFGYRLLDDLTVISMADGTVDETERTCLYMIANALGIYVSRVDEVLRYAEEAASGDELHKAC